MASSAAARFGDMLRKRISIGSRAALFFMAFAIPWVLIGDHLVLRFEQDIDGQLAQTVKGLLFVGISALIIKFVADRATAKLRAAHEHARRLSHQLQRAQEVAGIGSWEVDLASSRVTFNDRTLAIFELERGAFDGRRETFLTMLHPDDRPAFEAARAAWLAQGGMFAFEHRIVTPTGKTKWVRVRGEVIRGADGAPRYTTGTVEDVTDQKDAAFGVALLRIAGEAAKFGGWRHEVGTDRIVWSDEVARIHDEPSATHPTLARGFDYYAPEERARIERLFHECLEAGKAFDDVFKLITAKGRVIHARAIGEPEYDSRGRIVAVRGAFQDVTERLALDRRLQQAEKLETLGQLTGGVAHDFNNLLTIVLGNAELLSATAEDAASRELAQVIVEAAERGAGLTANLLAFARRQPLQPQPTDLNRFLAVNERLFRQGLHEGIKLVLHGEARDPIATIDPNKLQAALLNLIVNSRQALGTSGTVWIETANARFGEGELCAGEDVAPGDYVVITVTDDGPGMQPDVVARAFDPFFTTKAAQGGTGLGLSSVYGFAKQSGGHARVYSEPGHGTSIKLFVPRSTAVVPDRSAPTKRADPVGRGQHVLVVEDDPALRAYAVAQVRRLGYRVSEAADATRALAVLEAAGDVDLLFTDVVMPGGMNGRELAVAAKQRFPDLRVLYTSGYTLNVIAHDGRVDAGIDLLNKPYRADDLAQELARLLAEPSTIE
ncbi:MAG: response regulator [Geminicoccaceae bacterium]|nr:MAG: response regulator [Geminicoccaceae bacterium]